MKENVTLGASLIAAITASLCCVGPLVATLLGIGSFGVAAVFEAWRPYVLGVTFALLATAFYFTYRRQEVACADGPCRLSSASRWNKVLLWIVTVVVILFAAFPYYSGRLWAVFTGGAHRPTQAVASSESRWATVTMRVEGMTCAGCAASVRQALVRREGVKSADVSLEKKHAVVTYDSAKVTPELLVEAINQLGFKAQL